MVLKVEADPRLYRVADGVDAASGDVIDTVVTHLLDLDLLGQLYREAKEGLHDPQSRRRVVADACLRAAAAARKGGPAADAWKAMAAYFGG